MTIQCRVLVVEDTNADWEPLEAVLARHPTIALERAKNPEEARHKIDSTFFEVALIDADLGDLSKAHKTLFSGLDVAKYLRAQSPLTRRVLWTGHTMASRDILLKQMQPANDVFHYLLDKDTHPAYVPNLLALKEEVQQNWKLEIDIGDIDAEIDKKFPQSDRALVRDSLLVFLRRFFHSPIRSDHGSEPDQVISRVCLESMPGGMSGAFVAGVRVFAGTHQCSMCVLKVAEGQAIAKERRAYTRFVRYMLRRNRRVELLDAIENGRYGALLYSYAGLASERIQNAAAIWRETTDLTPLIDIVRGLFDPSNREWYADEVLETGHSLRTHLLNHYDITEYVPDMERSVKRVIAESTSIAEKIVGQNEDPQLRFADKYYLTDPMPILRKVRFDIPFISSVGHGDLHLGNLLAVDTQQWMLIDFERTGRVHCLQDFYSLEGSIRQTLGGQPIASSMAQEKLLLKLTKRLVEDRLIVPAPPPSNGESLSREYQLILEIRRLSMANFIHRMNYVEWLRQYFLGLTVMLIFILTRRNNPQNLRESMLFQAAYHFARLVDAFKD